MEKIGATAEETDLVLGAAATHAVTVSEIEAGLAVETEISYFFNAVQQKLDLY
jgi:hypothetical protein